MIFKRLIFSLLILLSSCVSVNVSNNNFTGADINESQKVLQERNYTCMKFEAKDLYSDNIVGNMKCMKQEKNQSCNKNYFIYLQYDIHTNIINGLNQSVKSSC